MCDGNHYWDQIKNIQKYKDESVNFPFYQEKGKTEIYNTHGLIINTKCELLKFKLLNIYLMWIKWNNKWKWAKNNNFTT